MILSSRVARLLKLTLLLTTTLGGVATAVPFEGAREFLLTELEKQAPSEQVSSAGTTPYMLENLATFQFGNTNGSDVWGWQAPDGQQYAIMGVDAGVVFVNATTLTVADTALGSGCLWQDMKTYGHYCYAISECGTGLRVIDMQYLPDSVSIVGIYPTTPFAGYSSHNASVDTVKGFLYLEGSNHENAIHIYDLSNPATPTYVGSFGVTLANEGVHDMMAVNDTVYVAAARNEFAAAYDLTDKFNPVMLFKITIPDAGYVHNIWPSTDRRHVITTEETSSKTVKIWNVEDPSDVRLVGEYLAPNGMAHNAQVLGDFVYLSHYASGIRVLDISQPTCPREVAAYDLSNDNDWGVYPHNSDSLVYGSSMDGRLFILRIRKDDSYVSTEPDGDNDGAGDVCDNCLGLYNPDQADTDTDGMGDLCDVCPNDPHNDIDGDGVCGDVDNCINYNPGQEDTDGDGFPDACDPCPFDFYNDADGDGWCANEDNCPDIYNDFQADADNDGVGDVCDPCPGDNLNDPDADGLCGLVDNCPFVNNPSQVDGDGDGVGDACDNCPQPNPAQADADADGVGDLCDNCINTQNLSQVNSDSDALGDACDNCPSVDNPLQEDFNADGIGDACCCLSRGDLDESGGATPVDVADLTMLVAYLFQGGATPGCPSASDIDSSGGEIDIADLTFLVAYLFVGGTTPSICP